MLDSKALRDVTYGVFIVTSVGEGKPAGCVINTFAQVTSEPLQASIALNKENFTCTAIQESGKFEISIVSEEMSIDTIRTFGFKSSATANKFEGLAVGDSEIGLKFLQDNVTAHLSVEVSQTLDLGTHLYFVGTIVAGEKLCDEQPMSYAYYHQAKGGKTPPKASSFIPKNL